jgi:hypothetical protein
MDKHFTGIGLFAATEDAQQRRLSNAIAGDDGNFIPFIQVKCDITKKGMNPVTFG